MTVEGLAPVPVVITSGSKIRLVNGAWRVPKRTLVGGLVSALEGGRLKVARDATYRRTVAGARISAMGPGCVKTLSDFSK